MTIDDLQRTLHDLNVDAMTLVRHPGVTSDRQGDWRGRLTVGWTATAVSNNGMVYTGEGSGPATALRALVAKLRGGG